MEPLWLHGQQVFQPSTVEADDHLPVDYCHRRGHDSDPHQLFHGRGIVDDVPPLEGEPFLRKKLFRSLAKVSTIGLDINKDLLGCHNFS